MGGMEGICHVGFWSFKREFLISFGLTWVMFIVTVRMSSQLPHGSKHHGTTAHCSSSAKHLGKVKQVNRIILHQLGVMDQERPDEPEERVSASGDENAA